MTKKGLFRLSLRGLGEVARVHPGAGDAGPYLDRDAYELLNFQPSFDALPSRDEYRQTAPAKHWMKSRTEDYWSDHA